MSNWRESDSEPPKKKQSPRQVSNTPPQASGSSPTSSDWRKGTAPTSAPAQPVPDWRQEEATSVPTSWHGLKKWSQISVLMLAVAVLSFVLVKKAFFGHPKLPLHVINVIDYEQAFELGRNPLASQCQQLVESINKSYVLSNVISDRRVLSEMTKKDWQLPNDPFFKRTNQATAWYICCYAALRPDGIDLYQENASPFSSNSNTVDLKLVLESIANYSSANSRFAWVILDLRLVPAVGSFGNLDPQWKTATENALKEVRSDLRDKLIVTLPADDGEMSWLAPEFSTSIFAHSLFSLLDSPPRGSWLDQLLERSIPLEKFRKELERDVTADAAQRRSAKQTPVWLPSDSVNSFKTLGLACGGGSGSYKPIKTPSANLATIESLWKKLDDDHYQAYRWDPVGHSRALSLLVRLEQLAFLDSSRLDPTLAETEKMLERIHQPQRSYGVSLIEDRSRKAFFNSVESKQPAIDFLHEKYFEELASLEPDAKLQQLWNFAVQVARSGDQDLRKQFFAKQKLNQILSAVDRSSPTPPLELYLLQRIARDIDWYVEDNNRVDACAALVDCFDRLQYCSSRPDPLICQWFQAELATHESRFLKAVDQLFAGRHQSAARELEPIIKELKDVLTPNINELELTLAAWRETPHIAPHAISWLLQEYQLSGTNEQKVIEDSLHKLGEVIQLFHDLKSELATTAPRHGSSEAAKRLSETGKLLPSHLKLLKTRFSEYVDQKTSSSPTSAAESSPLTFRRNLIALQSPLISAVQRETLHQNVSIFLQNVGLSDRSGNYESADTVPFRRLDSALLQLLSPIKSDNPLRKSIERMARSDLRFDLVSQGFFDQVDEAEIRLQSTAIGDLQHLSEHKALELPWQSWQRLERNGCAWQCQRLALAGWGNGAIKDSSRKNFYFGRLAENYIKPSNFSSVSPEESLRIAERALEEACKSLASLEARSSVAMSNDVAEGKVFVSAVPKIMSNTVTASLRGLAEQGELLNWHSATINDGKARLQSLNLASSGVSGEEGRVVGNAPLRLAADYLTRQSQTGIHLSVRGNIRFVHLEAEKQTGETAVLEFERKSSKGARISVDVTGDPPPINFAILIDCSRSMNLAVPVIREGVGQGFNERLMIQVRRSVKGLLQELDTIHKEKSANVRLCIIPFGLAHYDALPSPLRNNLIKNRKSVSQSKEVESEKLELKRRELELEISKTKDLDKRKSLENSLPGVGHFYATKFSTPDSDQLFDIFVDQLEPTYDTPLYDAIIEASNQLSSREGDRYILVFSDGVNYTNPESPYKSDANTPASVKSALDSSQSILKIFHFNYFDRWLNAELSSEKAKEMDEAWRNEFRDIQTKANEAGKRELTALTNGSYELSDNADALAKKAIESLPRTRISIESIAYKDDKKERTLVLEHRPFSGGKLEHRIKAEDLPSDFEVSVALPTGSKASKTISLIGGEYISLRLVSKSGKTHLEFPPFAPAVGKEWTKVEREMASSGTGGLSSDVWWNPDWSAARSKNDRFKHLNYRWAFRNRLEETFSAKPAFIVGLLEFPNAEKPFQSWTLADSWYEPDRHYPELRFPPVNIKQDGDAEAKMTLWVSDQVPVSVIREERVAKGQPTKYLGGEGVQVDWLTKDERQMVQVKVDYSKTKFGNNTNRIFVLNKSAQSSKRIFGETKEIHEFVHPDDCTEVVLEFVTIEGIERLVEKGTVAKIMTKLPTVPPNN